MVISRRQKNTHYDWLGTELTTRSRGSFVTQQRKNNELVFTLTVPPKFGKRKEIIPVFHQSGKGLGDRLFTWRFLESWQPVDGQRYRYSRLSLVISDIACSEMLSVHWNAHSPDSEPYQPHWHFNLNRDRYYLAKVHVPLDSGWGSTRPESLEDYHQWVKGLLLFIEGEFAHSLKLKRAS